MTDETKAPAPAGIPWSLIIRIIQVILALINYLALRETKASGKEVLERIRRGAETALNNAELNQKGLL